MKQQLLIATGILAVAFACKTKSNSREQLQSPAEQCEASSSYTWFAEKCRLKSELEAEQKKLACDAQGEDYLWINGECVKKDELTSPRERCEAQGNGSYWQIDPASKQASCVGPITQLKPRDECLAKTKQGYLWQVDRCVSPEEQKCTAGGDFWNEKKGCLKPEQKSCLDRQDGSQWQADRCVTAEEMSCLEKGYAFLWQNAAGKAQCERKLFLDYCEEGDKAPDEVQHTIKQLLSLKAINKTSCQTAAESLNQLTALDLSKRKLTSLLPLAKLANLQRLGLQANKIIDISALEGLVQLTELDLTDNAIVDITPLKGLKGLEALYLSYNQIENITALAGLAQLRSLYLKNNRLSSLAKLAPLEGEIQAGLNKLEVLDLAENCKLMDVTPLFALSKLTFLSLLQTGLNEAPSFPSSVEVLHSPCEN